MLKTDTPTLAKVVCAITIVLGMLIVGVPATAVEPNEILKDPQLEARARNLSLELRCLVCQNQSIDDSNAPLARDLRILVRERLKAGETDSQVLDFVVARYGEFVLLRPRMGWHTALLWLTPILVLAVGLALARTVFRSQPASAPADQLTTEEQRRLTEILKTPEHQVTTQPAQAAGNVQKPDQNS